MLLARVLARELGMTAVVATLAWFLLAGGLLNALAGYAQYGHVIPGFDFLVTRNATARVYGNIGHPNHYAAYLTMALCSVAYLYASGRMRAWSTIACAAWLLPALALSASRSPWFYLTIAAALAWMLFRSRREAGTRRLFVCSLGLLPGFVAAGLAASLWGGASSSAVAVTAEPVTSAQRLFDVAAGLAPRIELVAEAWQLFLSAPVLGAGWGQFAWHHFLHVAAVGATAAPGVYNHAHNIVLHLFAETGAIGGLLVMGAAVLWIADLKRIRLDLEWWWILALLAVLFAHSMVEYPLWYSYFLGVAAVLLGLGAQRAIRLKLPGFARLTVMVLMFAGWFNLVSVMHYYRDFERLVFLPDSRKAAKLDEKTFIDAIARIYSEPMLTPYVDLAVTFGFTMNEQNLPEKLALAGRVVRFAPISYLAYHQALLLALAGERETALRRFERAARAYPGDLGEVRSELSRLADRRPDVFAPLLELATSKNVELRAR
jgi:O-antigen ligase